jgi:hypothetical protein
MPLQVALKTSVCLVLLISLFVVWDSRIREEDASKLRSACVIISKILSLG